MNDKQRTFCEEYLIDLNATQAAIRAGYSEKTAYSIGSENLTKPEIADYIAELQGKRSQEAKKDAAWVLKEASSTYEKARDAEAYSAASSLLKLVGQHVDVKALVDRREVENTHRFEGMDDKELAKAYDAITGQND